MFDRVRDVPIQKIARLIELIHHQGVQEMPRFEMSFNPIHGGKHHGCAPYKDYREFCMIVQGGKEFCLTCHWDTPYFTFRLFGPEWRINLGAALHIPPVSNGTPSSRLDLHGMPLDSAYFCTKRFLREAQGRHKTVLIITGRSGPIRQEFPLWLETLGKTGHVLPNDGSFEVRP